MQPRCWIHTWDPTAPKVPRSWLKHNLEMDFSSGFALCPARGFGVLIRTTPATVVQFDLPLVPGELPFSEFVPAGFPPRFQNAEGLAACTAPTAALDPFLLVTHCSEDRVYIINMTTKKQVGDMFPPGFLKRPNHVTSQGCWTAVSFGIGGYKIALFRGSGQVWHYQRTLDTSHESTVEYHSITSIALDTRGNHLAMLRRGGTEVRRFDVETGRELLPPLVADLGHPVGCAYGENSLMVACRSVVAVQEFGEEATLVKTSGGDGDRFTIAGFKRQIQVLHTGEAIIRAFPGSSMWLLETNDTVRMNSMSPLRVAWIEAVVLAGFQRAARRAAAAPTPKRRRGRRG